MTEPKTSSLKWLHGLCLSSVFSLVYLLTPMYVLSSLILLCIQYPTRNIATIYAAPLIVSIILPSTAMPFLAMYMTSMLDYFEYEEILEISNEDALKLANSGKNYILAMQPHGVVSSPHPPKYNLITLTLLIHCNAYLHVLYVIKGFIL